MRKPRSDCKLLSLPEAQQAQLAEWLLSNTPYHVARDLVAKEFGVTVSLRAFSQFWEEVCSAELLRRRSRAVQTAQEIATDAERTPGRFDPATLDALKQKAFELSISPNSDPKQVKAIFALVLKARDQDLSERQITIDREKLELELQKYRDHVAAQKQALESELNLAKSSGGLTPETLARIEEAVKIL